MADERSSSVGSGGSSSGEPPRSRLGAFLAELRRRRVFRALVVYSIAAFAILQVVEPVTHGLHLPEWVLSLVVVLLALGFPVAIGLAWAFDLRATGVERTPPAEAAPDAPRRSRLRVALLLLGLSAAAAGAVFGLRAWLRPPPAPPSVAVLPFADMSPAKDQEYFADGVAEEILNGLAQVDGLRVCGRTSSFSFKGRNEDLRAIGRTLGVGAVLEGSVRKAGGRIRITAQLVQAADGFHLWSRTFDRDLADVFAVQDEIAREVVAALRARLAPERAAARGGTASREAYEHFLRGRELLRTRAPEDADRAVPVIERALALDPRYARAWLLLADALAFIDGVAGVGPSPERRRRWEDAIERAARLAPDLGTAYVKRGFFRGWVRHDWAGAEEDLRRARSLSPGSGEVATVQGRLLLALGKVREAIAELEDAAEADPLSSFTFQWLGQARASAGELSGAEAALARALELAPRGDSARDYLAALLVSSGRPAEALAASGKASVAWVKHTGAALAEHDLGRPRESQAALEALVAGHAADAAYQVAEVHAWRGERDQAFAWLERARVEADAGLGWLEADPLLRKLRDDPRWKPFLAKLNLPVE